jgi:uncharacterized repeat protein (TIGR01451 family)
MAQSVQVYLQAGETVQMGSSAMGYGDGTVRLFAPGAPITGTPLTDCVADQGAATGRITSRAQELAGPAPNAGGWTPCQTVAPADGFYTVQFVPRDTLNNLDPGTVDAPNVTPNLQGQNVPIWDVTVRDASGAVRPGRLFSRSWAFRTDGPGGTASDTNSYVYTKTGYEYRVNFYDHRGVNWLMTANDSGLLDATTGDRIYASFNFATGNGGATFGDAVRPPVERNFTQFINRPDADVIAALAAGSGYSTTPIAPATQPLADSAFSGADGRSGATNRGTGGTIAFTSPRAMEGLGYTIAIDTDRDGTFGNGTDLVDDSQELEGDGTNAYAWNGRDAAGNVPACGDYRYQVRSTLSEVHFTQNDVEASGGTRIERLSRPDDPALGNPLALSYNDVDPYKRTAITSANPVAVTDGTSGPGFHAYPDGDVDYIDTWVKLPEVSTTGTLRLLCADLAITKTPTATPAVPGSEISYDLAVTNHGGDEATNVRVSDALPSGLTYLSSSPECSGSGANVSCAVATLPAGASRTFRVTASVAGTLAGGTTLANTATVTNDTPDPDPRNNTSTVTVPVEPRADLEIVKNALSNTVVPGKTLAYELVVTNHGPSPAKNVSVSDSLPKGLSFVSASPACKETDGRIACTASSLASGASLTFTVTTKAASSVGDQVVNTAKVTSDTKDPDPSNNTSTETVPPGPEADLAIDKVPATGAVRIGEQVFYTLLVKNNGPSDARDVVVSDDATTGLTLVSAKASQGSCTVAAAKTTCKVGTVEAGGTMQVLVSARADAVGTLVDRAQVGSSTKDPNPRNNDDEEKTTSTAGPQDQPADLGIVKTSNRKTLSGSGTITYTLQVTNHGPGAAVGTQVVDTPSLPVRVRSVKSSVGRCTTKAPITCDLGTLAPGAKATITVAAQPLAAGTLRNSASVTGDVPDPRTDNNLDGASTKVRGVLKITKVASSRTVAAGGTVSYRVKVTNASAFAVGAVRVCDDLPSGLVYVSSAPRARLSSGKHCWTVATLGAHGSRSFTIRAKALKGASGRKVNVATATSPDAKAVRSTAAVQVARTALRAGGVTG